jgi:pimeloyl-ACP methyl ester carboxylesterase
MCSFYRFLFLVVFIAGSNLASAQSNEAVPPSVVELTIPSGDLRMTGFAYLAAGAGPHPSVLLLHGYPGNEKNLDVAQAMRREGWNVVFFHYRGAWGSEGEFSYRGAEQDVQTVLAYMRDAANAERLRIDKSKISIVGHSMGGHMAIAGILDNPHVQCAVAYDGVNIGAIAEGMAKSPERAKGWKAYGDNLFMLAGWSGEKAEKEVIEYAEEFDLRKRATSINGRPVLLIPADTQVIPMDLHINPLQAALEATENAHVTVTLIDDDHSYSGSRLELIETTADFLNASCK